MRNRRKGKRKLCLAGDKQNHSFNSCYESLDSLNITNEKVKFDLQTEESMKDNKLLNCPAGTARFKSLSSHRCIAQLIVPSTRLLILKAEESPL